MFLNWFEDHNQNPNKLETWLVPRHVSNWFGFWFWFGFGPQINWKRGSFLATFPIDLGTKTKIQINFRATFPIDLDYGFGLVLVPKSIGSVARSSPSFQLSWGPKPKSKSIGFWFGLGPQINWKRGSFVTTFLNWFWYLLWILEIFFYPLVVQCS